jgi:hypothetical protein
VICNSYVICTAVNINVFFNIGSIVSDEIPVSNFREEQQSIGFKSNEYREEKTRPMPMTTQRKSVALTRTASRIDSKRKNA